MKIRLMLIVLLVVNIMTLSGSESTNEVLPIKIQTFLNQHFKKYEIKELEYEENEGCKVKYTNGYKVKFDKNENWEEIESSYQPLPKSIIDLLPKNALTHISERYPRKVILKIKRKSYGYKVKFIGVSDLSFDKNGNLTDKD